MKKKDLLILLSGTLCSGKSTLTRHLQEKHGMNCVRSRDFLTTLAPADFLAKYDTLRDGLISYAQYLDETTNGLWLANQLNDCDLSGYCTILDAIRLKSQLDGIKEIFADKIAMIHIHLKASDQVLTGRFLGRNENRRTDIADAIYDYHYSREHQLEMRSCELEPEATLVILTDDLSPNAVYEEAAGFILQSLAGS